MSDKQDGISIGIGMSTFMMIFTVLCLTIFATLTYLQARHNQQETDKIIESTVAYYDADLSASKIYKELKTQYTDTTFLEDNGIEKDGNTYSYTVSISENRELKVTIEENDGKFNIIQWQEIAQSNDGYDYQGFVN